MTDDWGTPQALFDKLNEEFKFVLDVCALPHNAKCAQYFTPDVDGLSRRWSGQGGSVWCNPPYGKTIGLWMKKAYESSSSTNVVCLVPTRTNAPWWHEYVMNSKEIRFIEKKISFVGLKSGVPFTGHAIVVFGPTKHDDLPRVSSYRWRP